MNCCFFFNDTATTEIYTLSLHDALPISIVAAPQRQPGDQQDAEGGGAGSADGGGWMRTEQRHERPPTRGDRKSTRLNSSHANISYAVFCLKKKKLTQVLLSSLLPVLYYI